MILLTEEEYLEILETLPKDNQYLPDDDPQKFIAKMGAEAVHDLLQRIDLDQLCFRPASRRQPMKLLSNVKQKL